VQELDPGHAHLTAPHTRLLVRDWPGAAAGFTRAIQIEPNVDEAWALLAFVDVTQNGDVASARARLDAIPSRLKNAPSVLDASWNFAMLTRDFATAERVAPDFPAEEFPVRYPKSFYQGCVALARGDTESARTFFEQVRSMFEAGVRNRPDAPTFHNASGLLYAYMGRKEEAIRESRRAVELCPESKDALAGAGYEATLAVVYARTGEPDQAIGLIERLLSTPAAEGITLAELRLRWVWDPLRNDPRFQKILAGPEPKTIYK
jgi:tetratricopeptide (TPR) repeat protein